VIHGGVTTNAGPDDGRGATPLVRACLELSAVELTERPLEAVTRKMAALVHAMVPEAVCVSATVVDTRPRWTVAFSGPLAAILDERQYPPDYGPGVASSLTGRTIEVADLRSESRFTDFSRQAVRQGIRCVLSVAVPDVRGVRASLTAYGADECFGPEHRLLVSGFAAHAASAVCNAASLAAAVELADQLRSAMESRATIEQAKGMIMGRRGCTADEAFDELRAASTRSNRKLRDIARSLVDGRRLDGVWSDPPASRGNRRRDVPRGRGGPPARRS
jgi:hypothetical protein